MTKKDLLVEICDFTARKENYKELGIFKFAKLFFPDMFRYEFAYLHYQMMMIWLRTLDPRRKNRTERQGAFIVHREAAKSTNGSFLIPAFCVMLKGETIYIRREQLRHEDDFEFEKDKDGNFDYEKAKWIGEGDPNEIIPIKINENYIIIVSKTASMAEDFVVEIKNTIDTRSDLAQIFGEKHPSFIENDDTRSGDKKWTKSMFVTADGTVVRGLGAGQAVRGRKYLGSRPTLILADDLYDEENVKTEERRTGISDWFFNALVNSLDGEKGKIFVLGTIVHPDTVLRDIEALIEWYHIKRPIIGLEELKKGVELLNNNREDEMWLKRIEGKNAMEKLQATMTTLSWGDARNLHYIVTLYKMAADRGRLNNFYQEYMNEPIAPESKMVQRSVFPSVKIRVFREYNRQLCEFTKDGVIWRGDINIEIGVDIASSVALRSDDTVITVAGMARCWPRVEGVDWGSSESTLKEGKLFAVILHIEGGKYSTLQHEQLPGIAENLEKICNWYKVSRIKIEANGQQLQIIRTIRKYFQDKRIGVNIWEEYNNTNKAERVLSILLPVAQKYQEILCSADKQLIDKMYFQLLTIGLSDHDDYADSASIAFKDIRIPDNLKSYNGEGKKSTSRYELLCKKFGHQNAWKYV